jgi:hypothetical protein
MTQNQPNTPEITITPDSPDHGYYHISTSDIPYDHTNGEYWYSPDEIFLDQFHKYDDQIFLAIEATHKTGND